MARSSSSRLLVLNTGSSSVKYALFAGKEILQRGQVERLAGLPALRRALKKILTQIEKEHGTPDRVVHRVVHGGDRWITPVRLRPSIVKSLRQLVPLAPTHLPANLAGIAATADCWPTVSQWAVFDTAAFHRLPPYTRYYAIPIGVAQRYKIRKYGFHGISHTDAYLRACQKLHRQPNKTDGVTIHLGSGDSMTAWRAGQPFDTSMGFTPLEGLTMATRSGDLDPMIPLFLQTQAGMRIDQVAQLLQQRSGMFGISGLRDIRDILAAAGHPIQGWPKRPWTTKQRRHAKLAVDMFVYDVQRYLASYLGLLPKPKFIAFTGAVGQNAWVRRAILSGVRTARGLHVVVVPTDEETAIAEAVRRVIQ